MQSVRRAKRASLPGLRFSRRSQAAAFGAAMFAAYAHQVAELMSTTEIARPWPSTLHPGLARSSLPSSPERTRRPVQGRPGRQPLTPGVARDDNHHRTQRSVRDRHRADTFAIVAMDQRNTLKRMYAAVGNSEPSTEEMIVLKADVVSALGNAASGFLLDPTYGVPALAQIGGVGAPASWLRPSRRNAARSTDEPRYLPRPGARRHGCSPRAATR